MDKHKKQLKSSYSHSLLAFKSLGTTTTHIPGGKPYTFHILALQQKHRLLWQNRGKKRRELNPGGASQSESLYISIFFIPSRWLVHLPEVDSHPRALIGPFSRLHESHLNTLRFVGFTQYSSAGSNKWLERLERRRTQWPRLLHGHTADELICFLPNYFILYSFGQSAFSFSDFHHYNKTR